MMDETIAVIFAYIIKQYFEKEIKKGDLLKNAEIVIVDDGSKDKTLNLIIEYTKKYNKDNKIKVRGFQQT